MNLSLTPATRTQIALVLLGTGSAVGYVPGLAPRTIAAVLVLAAFLILAQVVPELVRLREQAAPEVDEAARRAEVETFRARIEASRAVGDPEGVVEARNALRERLDAEALLALDLDLVRWLIGLIQKRMRTGTMRPDIAVLAERVAQSFGHTPEGASLRASLPILRRSSGLCPRCGEPYTGIDAACPDCLGVAAAASPPVPSLDELISKPSEDEDPFLRPGGAGNDGADPVGAA
jgi:hypothetical protein